MAAVLIIDENNLEAIAAAIRSRGGVTNKFLPLEMPKGIMDIKIDYTMLDAIPAVQRTLTNLTSNAAFVRDFCFENGGALRSVNLPQATSIGGFAFASSENLISVSAPLVTTIGGNAFYNCSKLTEVDLPRFERLKDDSYSSSSIFAGCSALETINLPELTILYNSMFSRCASLTTVNIPKVQRVESYAFSSCSNLIKIKIPYWDRSNVRSVRDVFNNCHNLTALILPQDTVTDGFWQSLSGTPIAEKEGYIYVPRDLVASYESEWNGTYLFRAIEDFPLVCA